MILHYSSVTENKLNFYNLAIVRDSSFKAGAHLINNFHFNRFHYMVITNPREFPHISSQVDNKKLKPVEETKLIECYY